MSWEITRTQEWREIIDLMYDQLHTLKDAVIHAAGADIQPAKAFGVYDGYRRAIEKLESFGKE